MRILFISSGNSSQGIGVIVQNQGQSLINNQVEVSYFTIVGKGVKGYLKNIFVLRKFLKNNKFDIIHAHYSLSAYVATLAGSRPLVVSLMGSDTYMNFVFRILTRIFNFFFWDAVIVKSQRMKDLLNLKRAIILANGVDTYRFIPNDKILSREKIGFAANKKLVIFVSDPTRYEKNFPLAQRAVELLNDSDCELVAVYNTPNEKIADYMNAADVLLLTSLWEGSVNVVKEAMSCNLPVVSTDVGDVKQNTHGLTGYYTSDAEPELIAENLKIALKVDRSIIKGRDRLLQLELDADSVAQKLIDIYKGIKVKN